MAVWALSDLHLSFGVANKSMDIFGEHWKEHANKMEKNWKAVVQEDDLVLVSGDISWAMRPDEAVADLEWIAKLPGTKVLLRGNHDYWWSSYSKVKKILPPSIHAIHHNAMRWKEIAICGTRLWDTDEFNFRDVVHYRPNPAASDAEPELEERGGGEDLEADRKIFQRELARLEISLQQLDPSAAVRIAMTHYPPIGLHLAATMASELLEKYHIDLCVFGHLHSIPPGKAPFGTRHGVKYVLTSCDYLEFKPLKLLE